MTGASSREVLRNLNTLFQFGAAGLLSDQDLLERFVSGDRETPEGAFAVLVARHGAMVLGVCRRVLGNRHAAEDAFQATFFVLARKASGIARREQLACWLHGVARRAALDARARATRQRARENRLGAMSTFKQPDPIDSNELREILDEELSRLPERHRAAIVLCELEGLSRREAAGRLGVSEGTLSSRLARAKTRLRDRLTHRGLALSAAGLASALTADARAVTVPTLLADSTIRGASLVASGSSLTGVVSTSVVTLTEGVLKAMLLGKLKLVILGLATVALITTGVGVGAQSPPSDEDRLRAVERKLDRLLEVLEKAIPTVPASASPSGRSAGAASVPAYGVLVPVPGSPTAPVTAHGNPSASAFPTPVPPPPPAAPAEPAAPAGLAAGAAPMPAPAAAPVPPAVPVPAIAPTPAAAAVPPLPPGINPPVTGPPPELAQGPGMGATPRALHSQTHSLAARVDRLEQRLNNLERALAGLEGRLKGVNPRHGVGPSLNAPLPQGLPGAAGPGPGSAPRAAPSADLAPARALTGEPEIADARPSGAPVPLGVLPASAPASADAPRAETVPLQPVPPATPDGAPGNGSADTAPAAPAGAAPSPE